jgi:hypothetical protein
MRGRKPNPLRIQLAEGDPRKKGIKKLREAANQEIKTASGLPDPPDDMPFVDRREYLALRERLQEMDLDKSVDQICVQMAAMAIAEAKTRRTAQAMRTAHAYLSSLGLCGESSRLRIKSEKPDTSEKDLMAMLSMPRDKRKVVI